MRTTLWSGLLACGPLFACAEKVDFKKIAVPGSWELKILKVFFVYAKDDAPVGDKPASLKFFDLSFEAPSNASAAIKDYAGFEMSLVRYEDFLHIPTDFCCTQNDALLGKCKRADQVRFHASNSAVAEDEHAVFKHSIVASAKTTKDSVDTFVLEETGVFVLVFTNCGLQDASGVTVSGSMAVQNPFGFLPGIDYFKMTLYMWLTIIYVVLGLLWSLLCLRFRNELFHIQRCIGAVIAFGFSECALCYAHYRIWNDSGVVNMPIFFTSIFFTVVKSIFSYMLVLVGAMGWGITKPHLSTSVIRRIRCMVVVYAGLDLARTVITSGKDSNQLSFAIVVLVVMPISLLNGVIFYWVFGSLGQSIQTLKAENQNEKLKLFQNLWRVLFAALLLETVAQVCEVATFSRSIDVQWKTQWMFADGVSHVIYLVVLAAMMILWCPHDRTQRYAYSEQIDSQEKGGDQSDEDKQLKDRGSGDWDPPGVGAEPEVIGIRNGP